MPILPASVGVDSVPGVTEVLGQLSCYENVPGFHCLLLTFILKVLDLSDELPDLASSGDVFNLEILVDLLV